MRALMFLLLLAVSSVGAEKVLLIESYHAEYPWDVSYIKGIKDTMSSSAY